MIALHMVMGAYRDEYDVAVPMSADTDLIPAVETVLDLGRRCEVASWRHRSGFGSRLAVPGRRIWCHWLDEHDYTLVADPTDYTRSLPANHRRARDGTSEPRRSYRSHTGSQPAA